MTDKKQTAPSTSTPESSGDPSASQTTDKPAWPPTVAPEGMICRSCKYDLSGLAVIAPDGVVRCPECALFSMVSQRPQIPGDPMPENIVESKFQPGQALSIVGAIFAVAGLFYPYMPFAAMAMGACAIERSGGKRGLGTIIFALGVLLISHVLMPALWR